jgi:signal transduction histidine kinase
MGWWRRLGLRGRLMLVGTVGIVAGLVVGSFAIIASMNFALQRTSDRAADTTVAAIVDMINQNDAVPVPRPLPVPAGQVAQVLDAQQRVYAGSANADRLVPLLHDDEQRTALGGQRVEVRGDRALQDEPLRVTAVRAGQYTVIVAVSIGSFNQSVDLLRRVLFISLPLLVLIIALVAWRVLGAAMRPVEVLRAGAERITGAGSEERLPVPVARDEIHRLAVTLNNMIDRLARSRNRQRAFVADAAHELRSPLASIRLQLEVAQRLGDWTAVGDDIMIDVDRLGRLIDDLLLLARADDEDNRKGLTFGPIELQDLLRGAAARYAEARVPVTVAPGRPVWTDGDPDALHRVLVNLIDNAARHARTGVRLAAVQAIDRVLVTVTDDGAGIPEADRKRVFDRFTRLDDGRARDGGGTGLGLAIVRELVRRHGGQVTLADNRPGVRAELRLPSAAAPAEACPPEGPVEGDDETDHETDHETDQETDPDGPRAGRTAESPTGR